MVKMVRNQRKNQVLLLSVLTIASVFHPSHSFIPKIPLYQKNPIHSYRSATSTIQKQTGIGTQPQTPTISTLKNKLHTIISTTNRGKSSTPAQQTEIEQILRQIESLCPITAPARDVRMEGKWIVDYSTAPPPSNGQLGPFDGIARQVIDLDRGTYVNLLSVPPGNWLMAELRARWTEWDGVFLVNDGDGQSSSDVTSSMGVNENMDTTIVQSKEEKPSLLSSVMSIFDVSDKKMETDYGASCWKVDFDELSIALFGLRLFSKKFVDTSRIWKMSYLDDDTRIVRAGRTGKGDDDFVFYMTREL